MSTGVRLRTDRQTFEEWARVMPGVVLPKELGFSTAPLGGYAGDRVLPPVVAASLALHSCADVAITLNRWVPDQRVFSCFAIAGDLAASLVRGGDDVEIGLFGLSSVVPEVIRLVPAEPPRVADADGVAGVLDDTGGLHVDAAGVSANTAGVPGDASGVRVDTAGVEITVVAADAAAAGWQQTLVGGAPRWRRVRRRSAPAPAWLEPVLDVRQELAADLRFALADCIAIDE